MSDASRSDGESERKRRNDENSNSLADESESSYVPLRERKKRMASSSFSFYLYHLIDRLNMNKRNLFSLFYFHFKYEKVFKKNTSSVNPPTEQDANSMDSHKSNDSNSGSAAAVAAAAGAADAAMMAAMLGPKSHLSLLDQHNELKKKASSQRVSEREKQLKEEEKILASLAEAKALLSFSELAKGIQYLEPIKTSWSVPKCIRDLPEARHNEVRELTGISVEGDDVPPPIASFRVI